MKKWLSILFILMFILTTAPVFAVYHPPFTYQIVQENRIMNCSTGIIHLKRAPFTMILKLNHPLGILIAASEGPDRYLAAINEAPLEDFIKPATGMAESSFNENNDIMLSAEGTNYWYYENAKDHRFNKATASNGIITCKRYIKNIDFVDDANVDQPIEETEMQNLYLVFVYAEYHADTYDLKEIQRETLKIRFED